MDYNHQHISNLALSFVKSPVMQQYVDDLIQEGHVAAIQALKNYDASKDCSLNVYCSNRAKFAMIDWLRVHGPAPTYRFDNHSYQRVPTVRITIDKNDSTGVQASSLHSHTVSAELAMIYDEFIQNQQIEKEQRKSINKQQRVQRKARAKSIRLREKRVVNPAKPGGRPMTPEGAYIREIGITRCQLHRWGGIDYFKSMTEQERKDFIAKRTKAKGKE